MSRYIDADALTSKIRHFFFELINRVEPIMTDDGGAFDLKIVNPLLEVNKAIASIIREQPTADVVEAKHGEWFPIDVGDCCYRCSVCNFVRDAYLLEEDNYCPHCGARMDGAE